MAENKDQSLTEAEAVAALIAELGGVRPAAKVIGSPFTTVQYWKQKGTIPIERRSEIWSRAQAFGISKDLLFQALPKAKASDTESQNAQTSISEKASPVTNQTSKKRPPEQVTDKTITDKAAGKSTATKSISGHVAKKSDVSSASDQDSQHMSDLDSSTSKSEAKSTGTAKAPNKGSQGLGASAKLTLAAGLLFSTLAMIASGGAGWLIYDSGALEDLSIADKFKQDLQKISVRIDQEFADIDERVATSEHAFRSNIEAAEARLSNIETTLKNFETRQSARGQSPVVDALALSQLQQEADALREILTALEEDMIPDLEAAQTDLRDEITGELETLEQLTRATMNDSDAKLNRLETDMRSSLQAELLTRDHSLNALGATVERLDKTNVVAAQRLLASLTLYHAAQANMSLAPSLKLAQLTHANIPEAQRIIGNLDALALDDFRSYRELLTELPALISEATDTVMLPDQPSWGRRIARQFLSLIQIRKIEPDSDANFQGYEEASQLDILAQIRATTDAANDPVHAIDHVLSLVDLLKPDVKSAFQDWEIAANHRRSIDLWAFELVQLNTLEAARPDTNTSDDDAPAVETNKNG